MIVNAPAARATLLSPGRAQLAALLAGSLIVLHMVLPLDRGFPAPILLGKPVSYSILASVAILLVYSMLSLRALSVAAATRYAVVMTGFVAVLVQASLRAPGALAMTAMHGTMVFFSVFVLNYTIFRYAIVCGGRAILVRAAVGAGVLAAAIGILQSIFGVTITAYADWYFNYYQTPMPDAALSTVRAYGTLNQPILFGTALMLTIPFILELRSTLLRYAAIATVCLAAVLTGSRTILIVAAIFAGGSLMVYRARSVAKVALAAVAAILLLQATDFGAGLQNAARVPFLLSRLGIGSDAVATNAVENIQVRQSASTLAMEEVLGETDPVIAALGRGRTTAATVGAQVSRDYATIDNAFVTVLYEEGVVGLLLFCAAFAMFLYEARGAWRKSLHWYSALALLSVGISFNFEAYSSLNVVAAASMALASTANGIGIAVRPRVLMRASVVSRNWNRLKADPAV